MESMTWDSVKEKAANFADAAGKKAKELADLAQLEFALKMKESSLKDMYKKLGKAYYEKERLGEDTDEKLGEYLANADTLRAKIEEIRLAIQDVKTRDEDHSQL